MKLKYLQSDSKLADKQKAHTVNNMKLTQYQNIVSDISMGLGAILSQEQEGVVKVISYFSKTFSSTEQHYSVTRRELLTIVKSVQHFHHNDGNVELYGKHFKARTDHGSLTWLPTITMV